MNNEIKKDHYRNVLKSDHLSSADLEDLTEQGVKLIFTIKNVKQFKGVVEGGKRKGGVVVAGKNIDANIAYFVEDIKPMVLNATNAKTLKSFTGSPFVNDWNNVAVELYVDSNVQMKGATTQGVRISPIQPKIKVKKEFTEANFEGAKKANATREIIEKGYTITNEMFKKYQAYVTT